MSSAGGSPFYHCQLCTKAYSSEKSLNKHMRKKHGVSREQQQISRSLSFKSSQAVTEGTTQTPRKLAANQQQQKELAKQAPADDDMAIVCPECNGTIKSKKGVAKHYMCFHNIVYSAWKTGWFGRSVRLMDLTQAMIGKFYASGGTRRDSSEKSSNLEPEADSRQDDDEPTQALNSNSEENKETEEAEAAQFVEDEDGYTEEEKEEFEEDEEEPEGALVMDCVDDEGTQREEQSIGSSASVSQAVSKPAATVSPSRRRRSKLKTRLATTSPFSIGKDGQLEFNNNENPLDINCPFCIVHKTTIKGLAKHCANHHRVEYTNWKEGLYGSVQLRYIRPDSQQLSKSMSRFAVSRAKKNPPKRRHASERQTSSSPQEKNCSQPLAITSPQVKHKKERRLTTESLIYSPSGLNLINLVPCPICHKMVRGSSLAGHCATQHPERDKLNSSSGIRRKSEQAGAFEDDRQANPCPFCGELIFSKGMGKHCIYFHNEQYQDWKAGKFGNVPLRFVPSQIAGTAGACIDGEEGGVGEGLQKKNGLSVVFPTSEPVPDSSVSDVLSSAKLGTGSNFTLRIKPNQATTASQQTIEQTKDIIDSHVIGRIESAPNKDESSALLIDCDDDCDSADDSEVCDEDAAFTCHYCDATFETSDELKEHFAQKHIEEGAKATFGDQQDSRKKLMTGNRYQTPGRFICDICHTPYPSKRSLSQHYRIHKFDRLSSGAFATISTGKEASGSGENVSTSLEPGEVPPSATNKSRGEPVPQIPENADVVDVADLSIVDAKSSALSADCPKCCKAFSSKRFLFDHLIRCFCEPLSRGQLDTRDLAALAGIVDDNRAKSSSPPIEKSHFDYESQKVLNEHQEEVYKCRFCDRTFKTSSHIRNHEKFCCDDSTARVAYACEVCNKQFFMKCHLAVHMKVHKMTLDSTSEFGGPTEENSTLEEKFDCNQCGKSFSSSANLLKHKVVHTSSSVSCKACNREFKMACHLARHFCSAMSSGEGQQSDNIYEMDSEGNYECDLCHRTFQYAGNLTVHKRFCEQHGADASADPVAILLDAADEEFECSMCNEAFRDRLSLEIHMTACRLTDSKPTAVMTAASFADSFAEASQFECRRCQARFFTRHELLDHMSQHGYSTSDSVETKKKPAAPPPSKKPRLQLSTTVGSPLQFHCDLCTSHFSSSLGLVVHKSKCHPDVYGPGHRKAQQQQQQKEQQQQQQKQNRNRLITQILTMPEKHKQSASAAFANQNQSRIAPKVTKPSVASQLVITKSGPSKSKPPPPTAPGPPLLSLPNRCQHCPRAFLTLSKLSEHLANAHATQIRDDTSAKLDSGASPIGSLVLDISTDENGSSVGGAAVTCEDDKAGLGHQNDANSEADAYLCTECAKSFSTLEMLRRHVNSAHDIQPIESPQSRSLLAPSGARKRKSVPIATSSIGTA